ncbi:MAG: glycine--tRNA ligase subunit beta [Pseudomonadota bacterium]
MPDLLLELFSEEIPARMQTKAAEDLSRLVLKGFAETGLAHGAARAFATPRRLTLSVADLGDGTDTVREELKGPRTDAPEKALEGFLRKTGLSKDQLEIRDDKKGQVYFATLETPGRAAADVVAQVVTGVIRAFPWPKSMRWGAGDLRWVRPLRSILCILSTPKRATVVPFEIDGIASGDVAYGHRFLSRDKTGAPKPLKIRDFDDYVAQLKREKVTLDGAERAKKIARDAAKCAKEAGLELVEDPGLLREVAGLVEHPVVLIGDVEERFQALPAEVLQTSMREHQKFFSLRDPVSGRIVKFVTVANIQTKDKGARIVAGNARVLRARLADAEFFYHNDLAHPLESRLEKLASVTFHNQLGSQADRVVRIRGLARELAPRVGAEPDLADRAAALAKADLATEMVYEFPELQGLMGRRYAEAAGEPEAVAAAIEAHYAPTGPSDAVPTEPVAVAVALADKLDQLAGFWAIDAKPTGSGDPFALRRAALGAIRILLENGIRLRLGRSLSGHAARLNPDVAAVARRGAAVLAEGPAKRLDKIRADIAAEGYRPEAEARLTLERRLFDAPVQADLLAFLRERLKVYLRDASRPGGGVRHDAVDAVYALGEDDDLVRAASRIEALDGLLGTADGENLQAAFKRANNILAAEEKKDGVEYSLDPDPRLAESPAEAALFEALDAADAAIGPLLKAEDYPGAMAEMAKLRSPLDAFFDGVVVNAEQPILRRNRLCLLHRIRRTVAQVADFSALAG